MSLLLVGFIGMWELSIVTLIQVVAAVARVGGGGSAARNLGGSPAPRSRRFSAPILDFLQTVPSFVYIIPVVMLFTVGQVPGIIASVLYAIVPGCADHRSRHPPGIERID